ncbi:MAG: alpha/beta hydrolase [Lautropia sp.]
MSIFAVVALVALLALLAVAMLFATLVLFQDRLLYLPTRTPLAAYESTLLPVWPDRDEVRGLIAEPAPGATIRGTAVVFHGNAGHAGHRAFYLPPLADAGLRTILAEYPGYGPRNGKPSEQVLIDDAAATIGRVHAAFGAPIVVVGESLGAAVAAAAAARVRDRIAGLVLITPWDRLAEVAAYHYPWLPVRAMLREPWDTASHLADFDKPVVVALATDDAVVPARFGRALFDALSAPKHRREIEGAGHNDWAGRVDGAWWRETMDAAGLAPRR